jgi:polycomb protein EED
VCTTLGAARQSASCVAMVEYVLGFYLESLFLTVEQPISSVAVHPRTPSYVCTTSSDQSTRIYDLDRYADTPQVNPFWLPRTGPSKAGAPHGLRSSEREEWGKGLCVTILVGGRSGGHFAAVTCAAFHPTFPLIATGGVTVQLPSWHF